MSGPTRPLGRRARAAGTVAAVGLAAALAAGCGDPSPDAAGAGEGPGDGDEMRVTFVRHAESAGNASGRIDTSTPGPSLTPLGERQAGELAARLAGEGFDCVYASTMVRTQQTAAGVADELGTPVEVLPGLREVEAGEHEGLPEKEGYAKYFAAPSRWLAGDLEARIPGSMNGREFDQRVDEAMATIHAAGCRRPVVFSHGGAIMLWTQMNATNRDPALIKRNPLGNTDQVEVTGAPGRWTLASWNGAPVAP